MINGTFQSHRDPFQLGEDTHKHAAKIALQLLSNSHSGNGEGGNRGGEGKGEERLSVILYWD